MPVISTLEAILLSVLPVFTQPGGQLFLRLVIGWIICPARHTVTGILGYADPDGLRSHDSYHRFFRSGAWCTTALFRGNNDLRRAFLRQHPCDERRGWAGTTNAVDAHDEHPA